MIEKGNLEKGLQKHQQEAYKAVIENFKVSNRAAVVIPTGCGKSFIALQLMEDNKDKNILFTAPTLAIRNQMYNYIAKYIVGETPTKQRTAKTIATEHFPSLKIILYNSLLRTNDELLQKISPDIIIMDELHRTGADKWGEKVNRLLELNPNAKVLGLTATPDRMDNRNVVDELFDGNIAYELTLVEAIRERIVKAPDYVKCDYAFGEMLENIETQINNCEDEETKSELQKKYAQMKRILDEADGIQELFEKNIKDKSGKYIVFCRDKEHMEQMRGKMEEWFLNIDSTPEMYSVYAGYKSKENERTIKQFEESDSEHIKLLFSIDMLNEGLHVSDISGVIMLRPTSSRIMYLQQLGRALSSDTSKEKTIVFDLVNNYIQYNLDREINSYDRSKNREAWETDGERQETDNYGEYEDIGIFRIEGSTKEFLELLGEAEDILQYSESKRLQQAREIKEWMEERKTTKPPAVKSKDETEKKLAQKLSAIRCLVIKPYRELETDEEKEEYRKKHPEIDEILAIINWIDENNSTPILNKNAREIKKWMEERKTTKPPSSVAKDEEERQHGMRLRSIRRVLKQYEELETDEQREAFLEDYPLIDELIEIVKWIDQNNVPVKLLNARKVKKWMKERKTTKPPSQKSKDDEERSLGQALSGVRQEIIRPYKELETEEEREEFKKKHPETDEILAIINWIDEKNTPLKLQQAREIKKWMEERNTTKRPYERSDEERERKLGRAFNVIVQEFVKPYKELETEEEREEFKKKHPETDEILAIMNWIDENNIPVILQNARSVKEWMEKRKKQGIKAKVPSYISKDEDEEAAGRKFKTIRGQIINKYIKLGTEAEREAYRKKYPETDEILQICIDIYTEAGNDKQRELAGLIEQDLEKRRKLEKAKEVEAMLAQELQVNQLTGEGQGEK